MWRLRNQHQTETVVVKLACNMRYEATPREKKKRSEMTLMSRVLRA